MSVKAEKKDRQKLVFFPSSVFEKAKSINDLKKWLEENFAKRDFYRWTEELAKDKGFSRYTDEDVVKIVHAQRKK